MQDLMFITNNEDVALIAENNGVQRIFVDMEYIGKDLRQNKMDTVQNFHTIEDVRRIRKIITKSKLLVRINPIHEKTDDYCSSEEEINEVINAGADIIMLPYFKTIEEVTRFFNIINNRIDTILLIETPEAVKIIDDILELPEINEVYIGLNDLSIGLGKSFMFEPLAEGLVDDLANKFKEKGLKFGFGGIASVNKGMVPGHIIIKEHYRLDSSSAILSRSFCNVSLIVDNNKKLSNEEKIEINNIFSKGLNDINVLRTDCLNQKENNNDTYFSENRQVLINKVNEIVSKKCNG